jgi:hypothetical protein
MKKLSSFTIIVLVLIAICIVLWATIIFTKPGA